MGGGSSCTAVGNYTVDVVGPINADEFRYCDTLVSVTIGNSVTSIGNYAFADCWSLSSVTIGNSVTFISNYSFYNCDSLISINFPDSVTSIGNNAFQNCASLSSIIIPDSVTSIGSSAFASCTSLSYVAYTGMKEPSYGSSVFSPSNVSVVHVVHHYAKASFCGVDVIHDYGTDVFRCSIPYLSRASVVKLGLLTIVCQDFG